MYQPRKLVRESCKEQGCAITKPGTDLEFVILDGDKLALDGERSPDCLFFVAAESVLRVLLVELKRGALHTSEVVQKMTTGRRLALEVERDVGCPAEIRCVVASGEARPREIEQLRKNPEARKLGIARVRCGTSLDKAMAVAFPR